MHVISSILVYASLVKHVLITPVSEKPHTGLGSCKVSTSNEQQLSLLQSGWARLQPASPA